jgi:hypothetical protein
MTTGTTGKENWAPIIHLLEKAVDALAAGDQASYEQARDQARTESDQDRAWFQEKLETFSRNTGISTGPSRGR